MWATEQAQESAHALLESSAANSAATLAVQVDAQFDNIDAYLKTVEYRFRNAQTAQAKEDLRKSISGETKVVSLPFRIGFVDADGFLVWSTAKDWEPHLAGTLDLSNRSYFVRAKLGDSGFLHDGPFESRLTGEPIITVARRLEDDQEQFQGIVFAAVTATAIGQQMAALHLGDGFSIDLLTETFRPVVSIASSKRVGPTQKSHALTSEFESEVQNNPSRSAFFYGIGQYRDGVERMYAAQKLSKSPYWLVVGVQYGSGSHLWTGSVAVLWALCALTSGLILISFRAYSLRGQQLETEVQLRDRELVERDNFLQTVAENIPGLVSHWDRQLICDFASPSHMDFFGLEPSEITGLGMSMLLGKNRMESEQKYVDLALKGEKSSQEIWVKDISGEDRCLLVRYLPDQNGLFVFCIDITEAQKATTELKQSLKRIQELYDSAPCGYHSLDQKGVFQSINDTELDWLGYSREEIVGKKSVRDLVAPEDRERFMAAFVDFKLTGQVRELPLSFVCKNGDLVHVVVSSTAVYDDHGNYDHSRSVVLDITRIVEEQNNLNRVLAAAPNAVRVATLDNHRVLFMNEAFVKLMRRSHEEARRMDISRNYVNPEEFTEIMAELAQGRPVLNKLLALHVPDEPDLPPTWVLASYMIVRYNGKDASLAWFFDVTELHQAKAQAEAANSAKTRFLESVSHEIRTPLHQIFGSAVGLRNELANSEQKQQMDVIMSQSKVLLGMIEDVLAYSQLDLGNVGMQSTSIDLEMLRNQTQMAFGPACQDKGLGFTVEINNQVEGLASLTGDSNKIELIIHHLVQNAVKFTSSGHVGVIFRLSPLPEGKVNLQVRVSDTGQGLSPELREHLFDPFVKGELGSSKFSTGTGLGLALVQSRVVLMGGQIGVWSIPGNGSTFWVDLPLEAAFLQVQNPQIQA